MKKFSQIIKTAALVFVSAVFTSQCFAQSSARSASEINEQSRKYMELMNGVYDFVQRNYVDEVDPEVLYRGALKGMLDALGDPYTLYLDNSTFRGLSDTTKGTFG